MSHKQANRTEQVFSVQCEQLSHVDSKKKREKANKTDILRMTLFWSTIREETFDHNYIKATLQPHEQQIIKTLLENSTGKIM